MNTKIKSSFLKSFVVATAFSAGSLFNNDVIAQTVKDQSSSVASNSLMVDFNGTKNEFLVFDVSLSQPDEQKMILRITDEDNHQLYADAIFKKTFSKKFLIPSVDVKKVTFSLFSSKGELKKTFTVDYELKETYSVKEQVNN